MAAVLALTFFGCGLPSRIPSPTPATANPKASRYIVQFDKSGRSYGFSDEEWLSPNHRWKFVVKREERSYSGFYSARVVDTASSQQRILFTLWDADPGSGLRLGGRWSDDSEALRLKGETRGFANRNQRNEPFAFDLIYLVEDDRIFRVTEGG